MMKESKRLLVVICIGLAVGALGFFYFVAQSHKAPPVFQCKQPVCKCECSNPVLVANIKGPAELPEQLSPPVPVPVLTEGQVIPLQGNQWITLARPKSSEGEEYGDHCLATAGQRFVVLRPMSSLEALVRYQSTEKDEGGSACKDGTLGVLDVADFAIENQYALEVMKQKQRIEAALKGVRP